MEALETLTTTSARRKDKLYKIVNIPIAKLWEFFPETVAETARREGVKPGVIRRRRYLALHPEGSASSRASSRRSYARHRKAVNEACMRHRKAKQKESIPGAENHYQPWMLRDIKGLEKRVAKGETIVQIALGMGRTFWSVKRAKARFEVSKSRVKLRASGK